VVRGDDGLVAWGEVEERLIEVPGCDLVAAGDVLYSAPLFGWSCTTMGPRRPISRRPISRRPISCWSRGSVPAYRAGVGSADQARLQIRQPGRGANVDPDSRDSGQRNQEIAGRCSPWCYALRTCVARPSPIDPFRKAGSSWADPVRGSHGAELRQFWPRT
jgi:hypothetical protein